MKPLSVAIPIAHYHPGTTAEYVQRALTDLGHSAVILSFDQFVSAFESRSFDLYFCLDSGAALDLYHPALESGPWKRLCFWCIDFRHNKDRPGRSPTDLENAQLIAQRGGWIFQAQWEDLLDCQARGIANCSFLPLAADPSIWSDQPKEEKGFDVGFCGALYDQSRADALSLISSAKINLGYAGPRSLWKEDAASLLRRCRIGFNISSFYGTAASFDVNMRFFEVLSCGLPLVTNWVPSLDRFLPPDAPFVRTYKNIFDIVPTITAALGDERFLGSGPQARAWIISNSTYRHRIDQALRKLEAQGVFTSPMPPPSQTPWSGPPRFHIPVQQIRKRLEKTRGLSAVALVESHSIAGHILSAPLDEAPSGLPIAALQEACILAQGLSLSAEGAPLADFSLDTRLPETGDVSLSRSRRQAGTYCFVPAYPALRLDSWLLQVLPRALATLVAEPNCKVVVPVESTPAVLEAFPVLGVAAEQLVRLRGHSLWVERLLLPSIPSPEQLPYLLRMLRSRILASVHDRSAPSLRLASLTRRLYPEQDYRQLYKLLTERGFMVLPEQAPWISQLSLVARAKSFVSDNAPVLANALFLPESSEIIDMTEAALPDPLPLVFETLRHTVRQARKTSAQLAATLPA